jgi:hypothetical protein
MKYFTDYKFRCSDLGKIMVGTARQGLTEKQKQTLEELKRKEKLTDKQKEYLLELENKANAEPEISKTALYFLKELALEIVTGRRKEIETYPMIKGTEEEQESINLLNSFLKSNYQKNQKRLENEYIVGTPDIIDEKNKMVRDIKTSKDIFTFPYFEKELQNSDYYWQVIGYMWLTGYKEAYIDYVLINTPEWQIQRMLKNKYYEFIDRGFTDEELHFKENEYELTIRFNLTYDDLEIEQRIRTFKVEFSEDAIQKLINQINLIKMLDL